MTHRHESWFRAFFRNWREAGALPRCRRRPARSKLNLRYEIRRMRCSTGLSGPFSDEIANSPGRCLCAAADLRFGFLVKTSRVTVDVVFARPKGRSCAACGFLREARSRDAVAASAPQRTRALRPGTRGNLRESGPPGTIVRKATGVEIYRPLQADPKDLRRARAAEGTPET